MSIGPIPFTAIAEYFRIFDIDGDFDEFASVIRHMDDVYLELEAEQSKKSSAKKEDTPNASGNSNKNNPRKS